MPVSKILPGLWLGSTPTLYDILKLKYHNVRGVLSITKRRDECPCLRSFKRHHIWACVNTNEDVRYWFRSAFSFIDKHRESGVLIYWQVLVYHLVCLETCLLSL